MGLAGICVPFLELRPEGYDPGPEEPDCNCEIRSIFLVRKRTWILYKDSSRAHSRAPMQNPMWVLTVALLSRILTIA